MAARVETVPHLMSPDGIEEPSTTTSRECRLTCCHSCSSGGTTTTEEMLVEIFSVTEPLMHKAYDLPGLCSKSHFRMGRLTPAVTAS
jgi:hypothetical protein